MTQSNPTAGFIGLGAMGAPMARNLAAAGYLRGVWNRSRDRARSLAAELDVQAAQSLPDLAAQCEVLFLCVRDDAAVLEVIAALVPGLQAGAVVVDCSTVSADTARQAAAQVETAGGAFLDAPVTGGVEGARSGRLTAFVGGDAVTLDRVRPVLSAMASGLVHMGPVGNGQAAKAVNQLMAAGINQAVSEALALGEALQLDLDKLVDALASGAAGNWFLSHRGPSMIRDRFVPGFKLSLHHKDLEICRRLAEQVSDGDARLPVLEMTLIHYRRLMEAGYGDEDISALLRQKRALFRRP